MNNETRPLFIPHQLGVLEQGVAQGVERGASDLAELLKDLGVGKEVIDEAMQTLRDKRKQEASVEEE